MRLEDDSHSVRALRIAEQAGCVSLRHRQLLSPRRSEPAVDVVHLVEDKERRHRASSDEADDDYGLPQQRPRLRCLLQLGVSHASEKNDRRQRRCHRPYKRYPPSDRPHSAVDARLKPICAASTATEIASVARMKTSRISITTRTVALGNSRGASRNSSTWTALTSTTKREAMARRKRLTWNWQARRAPRSRFPATGHSAFGRARTRRRRRESAASTRPAGRASVAASASGPETPAITSVPTSPASTKPRPPGVNGQQRKQLRRGVGEHDQRRSRGGADGPERAEQRQVVEPGVRRRRHERSLPALTEPGADEVSIGEHLLGDTVHGWRRRSCGSAATDRRGR